MRIKIILLLIASSHSSASTLSCATLEEARKICRGKLIVEDQRNPAFEYHISTFTEKKIIIGEYHWLTQQKKNKYIFNEFISGRGAGDGTLNEYILTGNKIKLKRTIIFSPSGEYVDNFDLINAVEKKYSGNSMKVRKFRKIPFNYLKKCWGGNEPCSLPMHYATK